MVGIEGDKVSWINVQVNFVQTFAIHLDSTTEGGIQPNVQVLADFFVRQSFAKSCGDRVSISNEEEFEEEDVLVATCLIKGKKLGVSLLAN